MKVFEIFGYKSEAPELDYDMHDDLMYFISADPDFYRHTYYPFQNKVYAHCDKGNEVPASAFKKIVVRAFEDYKKKFPIKELSDKLSENDIEEICEKLQSQEINHYHESKRKQASENKK